MQSAPRFWPGRTALPSSIGQDGRQVLVLSSSAKGLLDGANVGEPQGSPRTRSLRLGASRIPVTLQNAPMRFPNVCGVTPDVTPGPQNHIVFNRICQYRWFNITNPVGMTKAGRVRALAVAAEQRLAQHADVPTLAEVGFPGIRAAQWIAAFAPAGLPADISAVLHKAFVAAMGVPEMQEAFVRGGMLVPRPSALADPKD